MWSKNQKWIDKKAKSMLPYKAVMLKATVAVAINFLLEIKEFPKEAIDNLDHIFSELRPISFSSLYIDQLKLAITEPNKFIKDLYSFYVSTATEITKTQSQEQFFHFLYTYQEKCSQENNIILEVFITIILYQLYYLIPNQNKIDYIVCGLTTYGKIMTVKVPYPGFHSAKLELEQCSNSAVVNVCKSHGIPVNSREEYNILYNMLDLYTQQVQQLTPFIDEYTYDILPDFKALKHREIDTPLFDIIFHDYFRKNFSEIVKQIRSKRRKTLPLNGVMIYFRSDDKDFPVQRVLMKEVFHSYKLTMLYKAETLIGDLPGYFDISSNVFYDILIKQWGKYDTCQSIFNMVIYLYACIVLDKENRLYENRNYYMTFVKERGDNNEVSDAFPYEVTIQSLGDEKEDIYQLKCKDIPPKDTSAKQYPIRITKVPGYIRRLPEGQSPSQTAKESAQKLGLELKDGETYVRQHEKSVRTTKQNSPWRQYISTAKGA